MKEMNIGNNVSVRKKVFVATLSLIALTAGIVIAAYWGNFSMRPKDTMNSMQNMEMKMEE